MIDKDHEFVRELLAAYAVHAVENNEIESVEIHVAECDACRRELDAHIATAALIGSAASAAPEGVWERVFEKIAPVAAPPLDIERARRKKHRFQNRKPFMAVAAAIVIVVAGFGVVNATSTHQTPEQHQVALAKAAARLPGSKTVTLASSVSQSRVVVVLSANGTSYVETGSLPTLPAGRTYQLWVFKQSGVPISAGVIGQTIHAVGFAPGDGVTTLAITDERDGGARMPTTTPVVSGAVPA